MTPCLSAVLIWSLGLEMVVVPYSSQAGCGGTLLSCSLSTVEAEAGGSLHIDSQAGDEIG